MESTEVYRPILEQLDKLTENPILADATTIHGIRTLIKDGVREEFFNPEEGENLLRKCDVVEALHKLQQQGVIVDE